MILRRFLAARRLVAIRAIFALSLSTTAAVACGIRTPLTDGLHEEPLSARDSGSSLADAASPPQRDSSPPDAGGGQKIDDAGNDVALPATNLGNVFLASGSYGSYEGGAIPTLSARGAFYPSVAATGCSIAPIAGCTLETCAASGAAAPLASAGSIAVAGGLYPLVLQEQVGGLYELPGDAGSMTLWNGGEGLIVTASGGNVPAFAANVIAPHQVTVVTPMPAHISRTGAQGFAWSGASAGMLAIELDSTAGQTSYYLECRFEVDIGSGALPAKALGSLPAGIATLRVATMNRTNVNAGSWRVAAFARTNANGPDGLEYTSTVPIE